MAKKKAVEVKVLTKEEEIEKASKDYFQDRTPVEIQPKPTRFFEVGEQVIIGHLKDVFIEKVLNDGMSYVYSCKWQSRGNEEGVLTYRTTWWYDINKLTTKNEDTPRLMSQYRRFPALAADIDSLLHHLNAGGLVIDTKYQRDYVWSEENKDALLESIFEQLDIGAFLLVRHHGYRNGNDETLRTYRTIDGNVVQVKANKDDTVAIVDGQQRLTTILDFVQERRPYKGVYFSQMHWQDKIEFMNKSIMYRIVEDEETSEKEIVRMFLQSNRGVPQSPEHIAKVQAIYDAMK